MDVSSEVSLNVSPEVSLGRTRSAAREASSKRPRGTGAGRYLVRSGSVYIFQIRVPKDLCGHELPLVRVSLGALTARQARIRADIMAAHARLFFEGVRTRKLANGQDEDGASSRSEAYGPGAPQFTGETPLEVLAEARGYLKAMASVISGEAPPSPPHQEAALEGLRGLVGIAREVAKGSAGNPLIIENADLLKARYVAKVQGADRAMATATTTTVGTSGEAPKAAPPAPESRIDALGPAAQPPAPSHSPKAAPRQPVPAFELDRRTVARPASSKPLFSTIAAEYFEARAVKSGEDNPDIKTARYRCDLFVELVGDHPVDTYTSADLQAYVKFLKYWPAKEKDRPRDLSAREIIAMNQDLSRKPLARKSLREGYVGAVKAVIRSRMAAYDYPNPFAGVTISYPDTATPSQAREPLSALQLSNIFAAGVGRGFLDEAMLPLLGHLTGRRLGLLVHLTGADIREKYEGVWVAQTNGIIKVNKTWQRVPIKTQASTTFFVLHDFLREIGFVEWATSQGDGFLFPELMRLADPSKSASSYMARLFKRAGITGKHKEVFHSLRGGYIEMMRDSKVDARDRKLQAGHTLSDEHDLYGFRAISESRAREMAHVRLMEGVDYSMFKGLDFDKLASAKRTSGRKKK